MKHDHIKRIIYGMDMLYKGSLKHDVIMVNIFFFYIDNERSLEVASTSAHL